MKQLSKSDINLLLTANYETVSKFIAKYNLDGIDEIVEGHRLRILVFCESICIKYDNVNNVVEYRYFSDGTTRITYSTERR